MVYYCKDDWPSHKPVQEYSCKNKKKKHVNTDDLKTWWVFNSSDSVLLISVSLLSV